MSETSSITLEADHRQRLLQGMAHALAARSYADTTIADIVREASVSRRTFYEYFDSKSACLIALYEAASRNALRVLQSAIDPGRDWQTQVEQGMSAYLDCLASNPVLLRALFVEILALGPAGLAVRRRANMEIARFMLDVVNGQGSARGRATLSPAMAMAVVGGINELILQAIETIEPDDASRLRELVGPASALVRAVARAG